MLSGPPQPLGRICGIFLRNCFASITHPSPSPCEPPTPQWPQPEPFHPPTPTRITCQAFIPSTIISVGEGTAHPRGSRHSNQSISRVTRVVLVPLVPPAPTLSKCCEVATTPSPTKLRPGFRSHVLQQCGWHCRVQMALRLSTSATLARHGKVLSARASR